MIDATKGPTTFSKWSAGLIGYWGALLSGGGGFLGLIGFLPGSSGVLGEDKADAAHVTLYCALLALPLVAGIALWRRGDSVARAMSVGIWCGIAFALTLRWTIWFLLIPPLPVSIAFVFLGPPLWIGWLSYWRFRILREQRSESSEPAEH